MAERNSAIENALREILAFGLLRNILSHYEPQKFKQATEALEMATNLQPESSLPVPVQFANAARAILDAPTRYDARKIWEEIKSLAPSDTAWGECCKAWQVRDGWINDEPTPADEAKADKIRLTLSTPSFLAG